MRKNNTAIIFGGLFFSCSVMAANGTLAPTVVPMVNGGQASIAISNTSPNLFTVPGDRIIAVNSLDGALTNNEQTASGGVVVATVNKKPFTFILETERGLNLSIQAVPREGAGRTIQLVSDLRGTGEEAGAWESRWRRSCAAPGGFSLPPASIPAMRWEWRRGSGREGCGAARQAPCA